jgi:DNA-binding transcriptional LysR family regulator
MMQRPLNIEVLRTFHAIARFRRFNKAARFLNKSPSAVTAQIQKLEENVGRKLLIRNNQVIELTTFGVDFLEKTRDFLAAHDKLQAAISSVPLKGKLHLGLPDSYAAQFIEQGMPYLLALNPSLEVEIEARSSGELLVMLKKHLIDAAIVVSKNEIEGGELLVHSSPVWVASKDFRMSRDASLPVAVQLKGCPYREACLSALDQNAVDYRIILESANSRAVEACIRSGLAVGVAEKYHAPDLLSGEKLSITLPNLPVYGVYLVVSDHGHVMPGLGETLRQGLRL